MPLDEFRIEFDNPTRSYFPGNNVTGRVIVSTPVEKKTQGLKIHFEGKVTVHWEEDVSETIPDHMRKDGESSTRTAKTYHDDSDNLFDFKMYALGDGRTDSNIPAGRNMYPFNFTLPAMNIPSSYVGEHGQVNYQVEATIKRSWKFDHVTSERFTVNAIVDLNTDVTAAEPEEKKSYKNFCCLCCTSGPVGFVIKLPRKGYVPGEYISPVVEILNQSNRGVNGISMSLIQTAIFYAQSSTKVSTKVIAHVKRPGVDPGDSATWEGKLLQVPAVPPSKLGGCRIIDVSYELKFELHVSGLAFNLKETIGIKIGTIPLQSQFLSINSDNSAGNWGVPGGGAGDFAPSAPNLYPEMPLPTYKDSFNFGPTPVQPTGVVENVTGTVLDKVVPKEENFVPKYVTYGWTMPPPEQQ